MVSLLYASASAVDATAFLLEHVSRRARRYAQRGRWAEDPDSVPLALRQRRSQGLMSDYAVRAARRAFYGWSTHIDHQLRVVIGTLREQRITR